MPGLNHTVGYTAGVCRELENYLVWRKKTHLFGNHLIYADDTTFLAESEEELKSFLMKKEREKVGLKLNIQKTKIMVSGPITSWEIDGETVETVSDFIFGGLRNRW